MDQCLDLSHAGASNTASRTGASTKVDTCLAGHDDRQNHRGRVASPGEPQECRRGLSFAATLRAVMGTIGDFVVERVGLE